MSLLPTVASKRLCLRVVFVRSLVTESLSSVSPDPPPLPLTKPAKSTKPRLFPHPRPADPPPRRSKLPPIFGQNQHLPGSQWQSTQSTQALLESIVAKFDAPIRYAFAYGSGVFEQDGYANASSSSEQVQTPMLDFMFAVTHPAHFHSINMQQHPNHYPLHARMLGSSYVSRIEEFGPGVWFNAYIPMKDAVRFMLLDLLDLGADTSNLCFIYSI
jgi:mitochondrial translocator assembly and maintenance protein 41